MISHPKIHVIDSHTAGEPTRVVLSGGPPLGNGTLAERLQLFREHFDHLRSAIVNEPRASEAAVGALLCPPSDPSCEIAVIFFNNVGYLGMCGHGIIGLVVTLAHLQRIKPGAHRIETPVGIVTAQLHESGEVTVTNVASYRTQTEVIIRIPGLEAIKGDVAWGGNWFFLTADCPLHLTLKNKDALTDYCSKIRSALLANRITGTDGQEIDHVELHSKATLPGADAKNFVLCPGKSYDRSPCGTGTSAKIACLHASGLLREGDVWIQQSITDTVFSASFSLIDGAVIPRITGSAFVVAEAHLLIDKRDPLKWGIRTPLDSPTDPISA